MQEPKVSKDFSCLGCTFCSRTVFFSADELPQWDDFETVCSHPNGNGRIDTSTWKTPNWCPLLPSSPEDEIRRLKRQNSFLMTKVARLTNRLNKIEKL